MTERRRVVAPQDNTQMTKQAARDGMSIEEQLKRYVNMGLVPSMGRQPSYGDFTGIGDFGEALGRVREAQEQFMMLPARVRQLCNNNPGEFLEQVFGGKPEFIEELVKAGLAKAMMPAATDPAAPGAAAPAAAPAAASDPKPAGTPAS